ncbi:hypothetical protein ACKWTF_010645 [Chironomus riparius]
MLKNLIRDSVCSKYSNVTYCCFRNFYQKMQNQEYRNPDANNFMRTSFNDEDKSVQRDLLKNLRKWVPIDQTNKPGFIFTIFNYNILSQQLLENHSYLYQDSPRAALKWNNRLYNIVGEIFKTNPSILCCQEVQWNHLSQIQNRLNCMNYAVLFKKRTGDKCDGCAIFYKKDLFQLIEEHNVEFNQPGIELLNRENVAIIAKLCLKSDPTIQFLVATTHLLYNPRREDIRLAQIQILLAELDRHAQIIDSNGQKTYMPVILTGDFNLKPYSAPYTFLTNGVLNYANLSSRSLVQVNKGSQTNQANGRRLLPIKLGITDNCQHVSEIKLYHSEQNNVAHNGHEDIELTKETVNDFQTGTLRHSFNFKSVYHNNGSDFNYVSTYQDQWILVDYIFYSSENKSNNINLQLLNYLSLPTSDECDRLKLRIPNPILGSDHLSLAAQFKLYSNDNNNSSVGKMTKL